MGLGVGKSLIIVESPAKAQTIEKYLGKDFLVEASFGHVKDLPKNALGVDIKRGFMPRFEIVPNRRRQLEKLKKSASIADKVYLAPDPDREGEAIAWHIAQELKKVSPNIQRILFHEITPEGIRKGLSAPRDLDMHMVESQLARRILDRLVGYKISPLLWKKVQGGLSAGRVQSVAVRLIVEREREIETFKPVEYWVIKALLGGDIEHPFTVTLKQWKGKKPDIHDETEANRVIERLKNAEFVVKDIEKKERRRQPPPPFITSSLQQEAGRLYHFSPTYTMSIAQKLYEGVDLGGERVGLITYMRTDSVRLSEEAVTSARDFIMNRFGKEYLPPKPYQYKNKKTSQDAHEAIRPTSVERDPKSIEEYLSKDEFRLYSLIYNRFLACQMASAVYDQTSVDVEADQAVFKATGSNLKKLGFLVLTKDERIDDKEENEKIPRDLKVGQILSLLEIKGEKRFTEPPPRFTEATLVKELEERGIGRPSTYATIVSTIQSKGYVKKEDGKLRPTLLGRAVNDLLVKAFSDIVDYSFTAKMEDELDKIEEGQKGRLDLLNAFYSKFEKELADAEETIASLKSQSLMTEYICEQCKRPMVIRFGKKGTFLGCSAYPECKNTLDVDENGDPKKQEHDVDLGKCPECGANLTIKRGRFGKFVACVGYPTCKYTKRASEGFLCPMEGCTGELLRRRSKKGSAFYSCSRYPDCKFATSRRPIKEECPSCGAKTMFLRGKDKICLRESCGHVKKSNKSDKDEQDIY